VKLINQPALHAKKIIQLKANGSGCGGLAGWPAQWLAVSQCNNINGVSIEKARRNACHQAGGHHQRPAGESQYLVAASARQYINGVE